MTLEGRTMLVTGASSGLGRAMADGFVEAGANVVYASRSLDSLDEAVAAVEEAGYPGTARRVQADVREWDDVLALVHRTELHFGDVDVLVNNAGVNQPKVNPDRTRRPVAEVPLTSMLTIVETNLLGPMLCTKAVLPRMLARDSGRLIHVSSGQGTTPKANRAPYAATKFGLEGFHGALARELEGTGVDSLTIRPPGGTYTSSSVLYDRTPEDYRNEGPEVMQHTAVRLAAGEGENGGGYEPTPDGEDFVEY